MGLAADSSPYYPYDPYPCDDAKFVASYGDNACSCASDYAVEITTANGGRCIFPTLDASWPNRLSSTYQTSEYYVNFDIPDWLQSSSLASSISPAVNDTDSWVVGSIKFSGVFLRGQQLADFPYDKQTLSIDVESGLDATDLQFVLLPGTSAAIAPAAGSPDGWDLKSTTASVANYTVARQSTTKSRLTLSFELNRKPEFFVNRFVTPLCLIHVISFTSLLMANTFTVRQSAVLTAFGSTVSFLFVAGNSVPQLPYTTRLDKFFSLCFFSCFLLFIYHGLCYLILERCKKPLDEAKKRNGGKLRWFSPASSKSTAPLSSDPTVGASSTASRDSAALTIDSPVNAGAAKAVDPLAKPAAAPKASKPVHFLGVVAESPLDLIDSVAFCLFSVAFIVASSSILSAPSS